MAAVRSPLSGDQFSLPPEETQGNHEQQLVSMYRSYRLEDSDLNELRDRLKKEGCSPEIIEEQVEKVRKLSSEPISPVMLAQVLEDYRQDLRSAVTSAGEHAIKNLIKTFVWNERHSVKLSVRIWFDPSINIRALKNGAKDIQRVTCNTVDEEKPVFEESVEVVDRQLVGGQINDLAARVEASFNQVLKQNQLPSRIVIEWKFACPEEHRETYHLDSVIPLLGSRFRIAVDRSHLHF